MNKPLLICRAIPKIDQNEKYKYGQYVQLPGITPHPTDNPKNTNGDEKDVLYIHTSSDWGMPKKLACFQIHSDTLERGSGIFETMEPFNIDIKTNMSTIQSATTENKNIQPDRKKEFFEGDRVYNNYEYTDKKESEIIYEQGAFYVLGEDKVTGNDMLLSDFSQYLQIIRTPKKDNNRPEYTYK